MLWVKLRCLTVGYYAIVLSPWLSLFLILTYSIAVNPTALALWNVSYSFILVQSSIIGFQILSLTLYLIGCIREEITRKTTPFIELMNFLLIIWGIVVFAFCLLFFRATVTVWDELAYAIECVKTLLWVASGLTFIVTSYKELQTIHHRFP